MNLGNFQPHSMVRREFLRVGGRLAAALATGIAPFGWPEPARGQQDIVVPGKEQMIVRSLRYLDLETPANLLDSWITPVARFYVRNHLAQPSVNLSEWRLEVTGEVERSLSLTLEELAAMETATVHNTMECAGNGRAFQRPRVPGIQWTRGAVGNAAFSGPQLGAVLKQAGLKPTARHVAFNGMDEPAGKVPDFIRSIPLKKALHADTLLATQMNGEPLTPEHGFPVRALVPGWLGAASVKWVAEVRVLENEFDGNFMKPGYRFPTRPVAAGGEVAAEEMAVITSLPVKSIITSPGDGAHLRRGPVALRGTAWAGEADVAGVDVSVDGGRTWQAARLGRDQARYAWRLWEHRWMPPAAGSYVLMARATDSQDRVQPETAAWNPSGYLWNAIERVRIRIEG